jgi:hypothetical protein
MEMHAAGFQKESGIAVFAQGDDVETLAASAKTIVCCSCIQVGQTRNKEFRFPSSPTAFVQLLRPAACNFRPAHSIRLESSVIAYLPSCNLITTRSAKPLLRSKKGN